MKRKIVMIDQDNCNGCGLCVVACHEGAIELVDGKARLVGDEYCDGGTACRPAQQSAITIEEREAKPFDEELVKRKWPSAPKQNSLAAVRLLSRTFTPKSSARAHVPSELGQWPVQLHLLNPAASFFQEPTCSLLQIAQLTAYGNFHQDFISGRIVAIGCRSWMTCRLIWKSLRQFSFITILPASLWWMEVPCCGGIVRAVRAAMEAAGAEIPYRGSCHWYPRQYCFRSNYLGGDAK